MKRFVSLTLVFLMIFAVACTPASAKGMRIYVPQPMEFGDESRNVKQIQERLIELGFLAYGEADGIYGAKTARAVHAFKQQNGIADYCTNESRCSISSDDYKAIISSSAKRYSEPALALGFNKDCYITWTNLSGNKLQINVEVFNSSKSRTVKAFELFVYATDVWDDRIWGEDFVYCWTTEKSVKPGAEVKSSSVNLPDRGSIHDVHIAIKRVKYSDGTTYEVPNSQLNYWHWTIK